MSSLKENRTKTHWLCSKPLTKRRYLIKYASIYVRFLVILDLTADAQDSRKANLRGLNAVAKFKRGEFDAAIDDFLSLEVNPAKVVALFPESISGRLFIPAENWIPLFGGPSRPKIPVSSSGTAETVRSPHRTPSPSSSVPRAKSILNNLKQAATKDDDAASIRSVRRDKSVGKSLLTNPFYFLL